MKREFKQPVRRREGGSATVIFIALLAIMTLLLMANSRALIHLRREIQLLDKHQVKRLETSQTNAVAITVPAPKPGSP
jgi:Tfp pilus assembly protein FimT